MRRALVSVVLVAVLAGSTVQALTRSHAYIPPGKCHGLTVSAKQFRAFSAKVWPKSRWERGQPKRSTIRAQRHKLRCARGPGHRKAMRHSWRATRRAFYRHRRHKLADLRAIAALTPYDCGSAGNFAVPCYIVACESGYSWSAYNPSGAAGPYQIMPFWGRPWPITSAADKREHHRLAARIWSGGAGAGNWVCA